MCALIQTPHLSKRCSNRKYPEKEAVTEVLTREEPLDDPNYVVLMREIRKEDAVWRA
ncbi:MAG: hypothetical protein IPO36_18640 [Anaerolineales bacterium]|nr:hypothetical protein [Anaerolineales bacterium]